MADPSGTGNRMDPRNFSRVKLTRYSDHFSSVMRPGKRVWGSIERYTAPQQASTPSGVGGTVAAPALSKKKEFQYNPTEVAYALTASQASPTGTFTAGTANQTVPIGTATFSLSLFFEREREVALYNALNNSLNAQNPPHKGVLTDIDDLYDLLLDQQAISGVNAAAPIIPSTPTDVADGGSGAATGQQSLNISDASLNQFYGTVFLSVPVLIRFSPMLSFAGICTDMQITFNKFSSELVPVFAQVQMGFVITSATTAAAGISAVTATPTTTPTTGTSTVPQGPGGTTPTGTLVSGTGPTSAGGV